jgi:hypothetical protein
MVLEKEKQQQVGQGRAGSRAMGRKEQQEQALQGEQEVVQGERGDGGGGGGVAAITPHAYHTGEQTKPPLLHPSLRHPPTYLPTHPPTHYLPGR